MSRKKRSPPPTAVPARTEPGEQTPPGDFAEFEQQLEARIGPLVQGGSRKQVINSVMTMYAEEIYSGPMPHPRHLRAYEDICPGSADRMLSMAEQRQAADIEFNKSEQAADHADMARGMWLGFLALLALIGAAMFSLYLGQLVMAGTFLGIGALGTVARFIQGRKNGNGPPSEKVTKGKS